MRRGGALAALALLAMGAYAFFAREEVEPETTPSTRELQASADARPMTATSPASASTKLGGADEPASPAPEASAASLLEIYQRPGSIRPFVLKAFSSHDARGIYYAANALSDCAALEDTGVLANPQPSGRHPFTGEALVLSNEAQVRQVEVSHYWNERCRDFTLDELRQLYLQAQRLSEQGQDKLRVADHAFFVKSGSSFPREARLNALRDVLAWNDPVLIDSLGLRIGIHGRPGGGVDFVFAGTRYPVNTEDDILSAVHLLPCGLGLRCDANEYSLAKACISYGECYESRFDAFRNGMMAGDPARYARTIGFYERMLASIKAGRAEDFVP